MFSEQIYQPTAKSDKSVLLEAIFQLHVLILTHIIWIECPTYQSDQSISVLRDVGLYFVFIFNIF